jgi:hypothetical protein
VQLHAPAQPQLLLLLLWLQTDHLLLQLLLAVLADSC